ncbi:heterokaryon incompatibility protein-domain-containing protein [Podospora conica]|nr:heterokaryon incompatibility protein-domain-containing protein [Schizothecium conicum]
MGFSFISHSFHQTIVGQGEISLSLVRRWIAECEKHEDCRLRSDSDVYKAQGRLPFARIIDVQDGSADPRLSDVGEVPSDARYMTLSHCWGDPEHKPLTLTLDTIAILKTGIQWNMLPRTFTDAIVFTRNLGIRYIWIDSLCIIQDSDADWANQSAVMCEIYSGSYLNIAATGAADSRGGLFAERDERSVQPLKVQISSPPPPPPGKPSSRGSVARYYDVLDEDEWLRQVERSPLCRRGWVLQERVLTRRSLHFGKRQLYWECTSMQAGESAPLGGLGNEDNFKSFDPLLPHRTSTGTALVVTWGKLVRKYTQSGLTKETDKLVAIYGLAKALEVQSSIRYLTGLWNHGVERQLLWHTGSRPKRRAVFCAPSWSWASTNSPVQWPDYWIIDTSKLVVQVVSVPPCGSLTTSTGNTALTIRGALIPGMLSPLLNPGYSELFTARTNPNNGRVLFKFRADSDSEQDNTGPVLLLPITIDVRDVIIVGHGGHNTVTGIVLKATDIKGTLRRVGYFRWSTGYISGKVPLRKLWLMDLYDIPSDNESDSTTDSSDDEARDFENTPLRNAHGNISSKTDPLEGVSEDLYHHYEEIGDSGDQARDARKSGFDWTPVFSGGFTFDLV